MKLSIELISSAPAADQVPMAVRTRLGNDEMRCRLSSATQFLEELPLRRPDLVLLPQVPRPIVDTLFRKLQSDYRCLNNPNAADLISPNPVSKSGEHELLALLTPRQREVLICTASGYCIREVACILSITKKSVDNHLARLRAVLGVKDRVQLCRFAIRVGLLDA